MNPEAYIGIPVDIADQFSHGKQVNVSVKGQHFTATIAGISAEVNPISRTLQLRISLPKESSVINGEIVYLHQQQHVTQAGYWVPISALTDGIRGLWNIYIVTSDKAEARLNAAMWKLSTRPKIWLISKGQYKKMNTMLTKGYKN